MNGDLAAPRDIIYNDERANGRKIIEYASKNLRKKKKCSRDKDYIRNWNRKYARRMRIDIEIEEFNRRSRPMWNTYARKDAVM